MTPKPKNFEPVFKCGLFQSDIEELYEVVKASTHKLRQRTLYRLDHYIEAEIFQSNWIGQHPNPERQHAIEYLLSRKQCPIPVRVILTIDPDNEISDRITKELRKINLLDAATMKKGPTQ